jgi:hypothetical protein
MYTHNANNIPGFTNIHHTFPLAATDRRTDGRTDGTTDGQTDGTVDRPWCYRNHDRPKYKSIWSGQKKQRQDD